MFPRPFGIIYANERPIYDENLVAQIDNVTAKKGKTPLNKILSGEKTWSIN